jgi:hypothetical protein
MLRIFVVCALTTLSNIAYADNEDDVQRWRKATGDSHYYNNECCYCAPVEGIRKTENGLTEYFSRGEWYIMSDHYIRKSDPNRPEPTFVICDPIRKQYPCVIENSGQGS